MGYHFDKEHSSSKHCVRARRWPRMERGPVAQSSAKVKTSCYIMLHEVIQFSLVICFRKWYKCSFWADKWNITNVKRVQGRIWFERFALCKIFYILHLWLSIKGHVFVPRSIAPNLASLAPEATLLESLYTLPVWFSYGVCGDFNMMVMILKLVYRFQLISIFLSTTELSQLVFFHTISD